MNLKGMEKLLERVLRRGSLQLWWGLYNWKTADQKVENSLTTKAVTVS